MQIVSCAKCRYQYELISGDIVSIESEEIRLVPSGFFICYEVYKFVFIVLELLSSFCLYCFHSITQFSQWILSSIG